MRAAILLAFVGGCIEAVQPDVGAALGPACIAGDSDPSTVVSYAADIRAGIIAGRGNCTRCHTPGGPNPIGFTIGGLDVSTYETLRAGGFTSGTDVLRPGDPCDSILYQKIGPSPPFGARMPYSGAPYLTDEDQRLIHDWIAEGASDN